MIRCVVPLRPIPIGEHYSSKPQAEGIRYPIDLYQCLDCSCVQTADDIDPEFLWQDYTYFSGHTPRIVRHFSEFVDQLVNDYGLNLPSWILAVMTVAFL
jgi:hypothetical protein